MIEIVCVTVNHSYQTLNVFRKKCWKTKNINKKVLKTLGFQHFFIWQGYKDSNLRMPESKSGALPTWLYPCILKLKWGG